MAGGIFEIPNKVLPGLYYNVVTITQAKKSGNVRGTVAMPMFLKWGDGFVTVTSEDFNNDKVFQKIGIKKNDEEIKLISQALSYCDKVLIYNTATGGEKSKGTLGDITITAKSSGSLGNHIVVAVIDKTPTASRRRRDVEKFFEVLTTVDGELMDKQRVSSYAELVENDYVVFSTESEDPTLSANAGIVLAGGVDGTPSDDYYTDFLDGLKNEKWNVLAGIGAKQTDKVSIISLIKDMRDNYGYNVQAVLHDYEDADYEGIIVTKQGFIGNGFEVTPEEFPVVVAGLTAGANMFISNTFKKIKGAKRILNEVSEKEIIEEIKKGVFMLGRNVDDEVVCCSDINSFISFTDEKNEDLSKNKVLRIVYEVIQSIRREAERNVIGQMANTENNRQLFKSKLVLSLSNLNGTAIEDFKPEDLNVVKGDKKNEMFVDLGFLPIDAVEKIYLRVKVM